MCSPQKSGQNIEMWQVELEIRDDALVFISVLIGAQNNIKTTYMH